jgi:hypothetical protein
MQYFMLYSFSLLLHFICSMNVHGEATNGEYTARAKNDPKQGKK